MQVKGCRQSSAGRLVSISYRLDCLRGCIQRVVGLLAGLAGDAASVGNCSQLDSSIAKTAEHAGEQLCVVGGWRASCGNAGIAGGLMTRGAGGGGAEAQPVTSSTSSSSAHATAPAAILSFIDDLLDCGLPQPLPLAGGLRGGGGLARLAFVFLCDRDPQVGESVLRSIQAHRLHAGSDDGRRGDAAQRGGDDSIDHGVGSFEVAFCATLPAT